ncbi:nuclease-related domain-containing protein [Neobacillus niacini]|uniref:nuclease-related domain-containing protein n=1 Tax=Neobacillus niacini TaxID=86668 RepID=UPI0021CB724D|nr:nuclease-related domain-containing protein [Neobacillus niacini]MCM3763977.1 NERD domain-containing protein [Neobacillus niacini]
MEDKPCSIPLRILKLEALLEGRLCPNHPTIPDIAAEYRRRLAGFRGEKALEFHLSMLSQQKFHIFHNIRLKLGNYYFQIDYLILCSSFAIALEVKNMSGEIIFKKELNQVFWKKNEVVERIKNPVLQARLQARKLKMWLRKHQIEDLPVHYLFVNSNEKTRITVEPGNEQVLQVSCNSEGVVDKIEQIANVNMVEKLDSKQLKKLRRLILTKHTPENPDLLKQFNLSPHEILPGVKCPNCDFLSMFY